MTDLSEEMRVGIACMCCGSFIGVAIGRPRSCFPCRQERRAELAEEERLVTKFSCRTDDETGLLKDLLGG